MLGLKLQGFGLMLLLEFMLGLRLMFGLGLGLM